MPLSIIRNDITKVKADAIVNTANPKPVIGAGTDSAVYAAAGETKLLEARKRIGDIKPGTAVETSAYNLDAKFIIHTVCIPWKSGNAEALDVLANCYHRSLVLAEELNCKSIAFPLIGTGAYGIPHDDAIGVANEVIKTFLKEHDSSMKVMLVLFDKESVKSGESLSNKIKSYIDENYVENAVVNEYGLTEDDVREITSLKRRREMYHRELQMSYPRMNVPPDRFDDPTKSFAEKMFDYADRKGIKDSALYGGSRELFFKRQTLSLMRSNYDYHPSKYVCIAVCLVLELDLEDTLDMLSRAGYTLSRSRKADVVVRACIDMGIHDYFAVNNRLLENGCDALSKIK